MSEQAVSTPGKEPELRRVLGPRLLLLFIIGDVLGTGVYALTGSVAGEVGGAAWAPFLVAFIVATLTACSYLELVTKYPQAAGAALYTHKAFGLHFLTFMVTFTVMCSGITSASTASRAFAGFFGSAFNLGGDDGVSTTFITVVAICFMLGVGAINFRGVGESVKTNVVLTIVELSGLLMIIFVGLWAIVDGSAQEMQQLTMFATDEGKNAFLAVSAGTSLAFFAMVGFEDAVNMAEETKNPSDIFPKIMFTGLSIAGLIYVLVGICAVSLVPVGDLSDPTAEPALVQVMTAAAPDIPFDELLPWISMFAVANSALINMLMASRLIYGMARQGILPISLGHVHLTRRTPWVAIIFTTALSLMLIIGVGAVSDDAVATLGGTTALLLLGVFAVVNVAVLVLRKDRVDHKHFTTPTAIALTGVVTCVWFVLPFSGRAAEQYQVAGLLLLLGVVLWLLTWFANRALRAQRTYIKDPTDL